MEDGDYQKSQSRNKSSSFAIKNSGAESWLSGKVLLEGTKPMNTERKACIPRKVKIQTTVLNLLQTIKILNRGSKSFSQSFVFYKRETFFETLREEIKPVACENFGFEDRDKSLLLAFPGTSGQSNVQTTEQK